MAYRRQIKCISKTDRLNEHDRIISIGGVTAVGVPWKVSLQEAISGIESGEFSFYVLQKGYVADVIVVKSASGAKYLKTERDTVDVNNLLALPECLHEVKD